MHILKSMVIAFSIYSKIPVPQFDWKEEDMKYMMCFFPWIGAVIGIVLWLWGMLCEKLEVGNLTYALIGTAIPLLLTGGFHVDGFMDTMDAFHSYQPRERKLEILKDSHIGAFAAIMLGTCGLLYVGGFASVTDLELLKGVAAGFFLSRCLSGLSVVTFPSAKKEGMLHYFADSAQKKRVQVILGIEAVFCMAVMVLVAQLAGILLVAAELLAFAYYRYRTQKELGGITGDTAGYFIVLSESAMMLMAAAINCLR